MKIGRNDPCPCGSGKKYKQCCLAAATAAQESSHTALIRRLNAEIPDGGKPWLDHLLQTYGATAVAEAWRQFCAGSDSVELGPKDSPLATVFSSWLLHDWAPVPADTLVTDHTLHGVVPMQAYLRRRGGYQPRVLREYLEACLARPLRFYRVLGLESSGVLDLCDLFTGERCTAHDLMAQRAHWHDEVLFTRVITVQGISLIEPVDAPQLSPACVAKLIAVRRRLRGIDGQIADTALAGCEAELRRLYLDSVSRRWSPDPVLVPIEGGDPGLYRLEYEIESGDAVYRALRHLSPEFAQDDVTATDDQALEDPWWLSDMEWAETTEAAPGCTRVSVHGLIRIGQYRLMAWLVSRARSDAFRAIVAERLPDLARFVDEQIQPLAHCFGQEVHIEPAIRNEYDWSQDDDGREDGLDEAWDDDSDATPPWLRARVQPYFDAWPDTPLPLLDDRSPREAMRDEDGREQVTALLSQIEIDAVMGRLPIGLNAVRSFREQLCPPQENPEPEVHGLCQER